MNDNDLFGPGASVSVVATTSPQTAALPAAARVVLLTNPGATPVYYKLGSASVVASVTTCDCVLPGTKELFAAGGATHISVVTELGSARLIATIGYGEL
jgi:hypothetical protein